MGKAKKTKEKSVQDDQALNLQIVSEAGEVRLELSRPVTVIRFNAAQASQFAEAMRGASQKSSQNLNNKLQKLADAVGGLDKLREIADRAKNNGGPVEEPCENNGNHGSPGSSSLPPS